MNFRIDFRQQSEQIAIQSYRGLLRDFRTRFLKICDEAGVKNLQTVPELRMDTAN